MKICKYLVATSQLGLSLTFFLRFRVSGMRPCVVMEGRQQQSTALKIFLSEFIFSPNSEHRFAHLSNDSTVKK